MSDLRPNYGGGDEDNGDLLQKVPPACSRPPPTHASTGDLDTPRQVWVSLLWGHCSFLLGPGVHKVPFVPAKSLFLQSCGSSGGSAVGLRRPPPRGLMPYPRLLYPEPLPLQQATLTRASTGDAQTQFWLRLCGVSGSWCAQGLFEPSERLWRVRGLIVSAISPLLPSCWGFLFALGRGGSSLVGSNILLPTVVQQ